MEPQARAIRPVADRRESPGLEQRELRHIGRLAYPRWRIAADVEKRRLFESGDELEFVVAYAQGRVMDPLIYRVPGEERDIQLVIFGGVAELIHPDGSAPPAHVANEHRGHTLKVFR